MFPSNVSSTTTIHKNIFATSVCHVFDCFAEENPQVAARRHQRAAVLGSSIAGGCAGHTALYSAHTIPKHERRGCVGNLVRIRQSH